MYIYTRYSKRRTYCHVCVVREVSAFGTTSLFVYTNNVRAGCLLQKKPRVDDGPAVGGSRYGFSQFFCPSTVRELSLLTPTTKGEKSNIIIYIILQIYDTAAISLVNYKTIILSGNRCLGTA